MTRSLSESLHGGSPDGWALDFLAAARFPASPGNVQVVVSWEYAESGAGGGMWNPLNTTQGGYPGETNLNSVGVKNYVRREDGIAANAKVIHNGFYPRVVAAFERGNDPRTICDLITASPWGTGPIALRGTPPPVTPPHPPSEVPEMQFIVLPGVGRPTGRDPLAVWDPAHPNRITLENGGRLKGSDTTSLHNVRVWEPKNTDGTSPIPDGVHGLGIAPRFLHGAMIGVVLACSGGNTYRADIP